MTKRALTGCLKYQLGRMKRAFLFIPVICVTLMCIIMVLACESIVLTDALSFIDLISVFFAFIVVIGRSSELMNTAAANGASRTTAALALVISVGVLSLVMTAECGALTALAGLVTGERPMLAAEIYGSAQELIGGGMNALLAYLRIYGICFMLHFAGGAAGLMFSAIDYRVSAVFRILILATGGVMLIIWSATASETGTSLARLVGLGCLYDGGTVGNAAQGMLFMGIAALIMTAAAFAIYRKSAVSTAAANINVQI